MANETKNVKISTERRVETQLEPDLTIHWPAIEFDADALTEWIQPRVTGMVSGIAPKGERRESWILDVNCFHRISDQTQDSTHRIWEIVDLVIAAFAQVDMPVKDWADPALPVLFYVRWNEGSVTNVPQPVSPKGDTITQQVNVSFTGTVIT